MAADPDDLPKRESAEQRACRNSALIMRSRQSSDLAHGGQA
jgi:hypothetical protein